MARKILFINQEISPYVNDSELSQIGLELPHQCLENGWEIRTFMPKWGNINERRGQLHEVIRLSGMNLIINETDHPLIIKVATVQPQKVQVYFIDSDDYFAKRMMAQDADGKEYEDNGERAIFYARGVLETVKKLRWTPDVIHCQGWISALVPIYVKTAYHDEPSFSGAKVVTSLFNKGFNGSLEENFLRDAAFRDTNEKILAAYKSDVDYEELCRMAIDYSDGVIEQGSNVDKSLLDYARQKGKAMEGRDCDMQAFYAQLLSK